MSKLEASDPTKKAVMSYGRVQARIKPAKKGKLIGKSIKVAPEVAHPPPPKLKHSLSGPNPIKSEIALHIKANHTRMTQGYF